MGDSKDKIDKANAVVERILCENNVKHLSEGEEFKQFSFKVDRDGKHLDVIIKAYEDAILVTCIYPFKVQSNAIALVSMFLSTVNYYSVNCSLKLNQSNGDLAYESFIPMCVETIVDTEYLWKDISNSIDFALDHYLILSNYSVGKLSVEEKEKYTRLLLSSFDAINGDKISYSKLGYGTAGFQEDFFWKQDAIESLEKWVSATKEWYDNNLPFCR